MITVYLTHPAARLIPLSTQPLPELRSPSLPSLGAHTNWSDVLQVFLPAQNKWGFPQNERDKLPQYPGNEKFHYEVNHSDGEGEGVALSAKIRTQNDH